MLLISSKLLQLSLQICMDFHESFHNLSNFFREHARGTRAIFHLCSKPSYYSQLLGNVVSVFFGNPVRNFAKIEGMETEWNPHASISKFSSCQNCQSKVFTEEFSQQIVLQIILRIFQIFRAKVYTSIKHSYMSTANIIMRNKDRCSALAWLFARFSWFCFYFI